MIGKKLGRYNILREIGSGGMATVFLANDERLGREVALKLLHPHLSSKKENRERIEREARGLARLRQENIIEVYDFSDPGSRECFIVTEFISGDTLRNFGESRGKLMPELAVMIAIEIAQALEAAHSAGIIHRDVKPENVMISREGRVKLMDFGIAHLLGGEGMTVTGHLIGSPAFMSPEQAKGEKIDARSDIFSLGLVLYWMTAGRMPFETNSTPAVIKAICEGEFDSPQIFNPSISNRLAGLIIQMLSDNPAGRPQTAAELIVELKKNLASVGLIDYHPLLGAYLGDPDRVEARVVEIVVENLVTACDRALKRRNYSAALERLNWLMTLKPDDERAEELLRRVTRGGSFAKKVAVLMMTVAIAAAAWGFGTTDWLSWRPPDKNIPLEPAPIDAYIQAVSSPVTDTVGFAVTSPTEPKAEEAQTEPTDVRPQRKNHRRSANKSTRDKKAGKEEGIEFGVLKLHIVPHGRVYINGREYSRESKIDHVYRLPIGAHTVVVTNPYYEDARFKVAIPKDKAVIKKGVRLEQLPSFIKIIAPREAIIYIDDKPIGRGPRQVVEVAYGQHLVSIKINNELKPPQPIEAIPGQIPTITFSIP